MHSLPFEINFLWNQLLKKKTDEGCQCKASLIQWQFQSKKCSANNLLLCSHKRRIIFHPIFSVGTTAARGDLLFQQNHIYYFELVIESTLEGTDTLIGLASEKFDLNKYSNEYYSYVGSDELSWGYSCKGYIQHNKLRRNYGGGFETGDVVGVCVNLFEGTIEYFLNGKSLGMAFKGIKCNKTYYPVISSTTKQATLTLLKSEVRKIDLQIRCIKQLMNFPPELLQTYMQEYKFLFQHQPKWIIPCRKTVESPKEDLLFDELLWS